MSQTNGTGASPLDAIDVLPDNPEPEDLAEALKAFRAGLEPLDPITRQTFRGAAVKRIEGLGVRAPAATIDAVFAGLGTKPANDVVSEKLTDPEPWDAPVDGEDLLDDLVKRFSRHLVLPRYAAEALALWVVHTYTYDFGEVTPRLAVTSPEKRCGKSSLLHILGAVCSRPIPASNISPAAVFRSIERWKPTLLVDEADTFLRQNEELRGVLNAGHGRANSKVIRCDGDANEPRIFSTWAPVAIACIGSLPSTLEDRAIEIKMRRKARGEQVDRIRLRELREDPVEWRRRAVRWAKDSGAALGCSDPALPEDLDDRARDNWEPLVAIADLAGGRWPVLARAAAKALSAGRDDSEGSRGVELLRDLRDVLGDREKMTTDDLLKALVALDDRPWREYGRKTKPLSARQLGVLLRPFGVKPKVLSFGGVQARGYERADLEDTFLRYLPPLQPVNPSTAYENRGEPLTGDAVMTDGPVTVCPHENQSDDGMTDENTPLEEGVYALGADREPGDEEEDPWSPG